METYPEHEKLQAVQRESEAQGQFLDWLINERRPRLVIAEYVGSGDALEPARPKIVELLAEFHGIDLGKIEAEKRALLTSILAKSEGK